MFAAQTLMPQESISGDILNYVSHLKACLQDCADKHHHKPVSISSFCGPEFGNHIEEYFSMPLGGPPVRLVTPTVHQAFMKRIVSAHYHLRKENIIKDDERHSLENAYLAYKDGMAFWNAKVNRSVFLPKGNLESSIIFVRRALEDRWRSVKLNDPEAFWEFLKTEVYERRARGDFVGAMRMSYSILNILKNKPYELTSDQQMLKVYKALAIFTGDWAAYISENYTMQRFYINELRQLWREFPDIQIKNRIFNTYGKHNPHSRFAFRVLETHDLEITVSKMLFYPNGISSSIFNAFVAAMKQGADLDTPIKEMLGMSPSAAVRYAWTLELENGDVEDALFTMPIHAKWLGYFGRLDEAFLIIEEAQKIHAKDKHLHIGLRVMEVNVELLKRQYNATHTTVDLNFWLRAQHELSKAYEQRRTPNNLRQTGIEQ